MFAYVIPSLWGKPVNVWGGILLAALVIFQVLVGTRVVKLPFTWHKVNGFLILFVALAHGFIGYMFWFHHWMYK
jgi:hypothetical protein